MPSAVHDLAAGTIRNYKQGREGASICRGNSESLIETRLVVSVGGRATYLVDRWTHKQGNHMSEKDGYQDYLNQSASAANAAGVAHHDPNVQARQNRLAGGVSPAVVAGSSGGFGGALSGFLVIGLLVLFVLPFVYYYFGLNQALVNYGIATCEPIANNGFKAWASGDWCQGHLVSNRVWDALIFYVIFFALMALIVRMFGYFVALVFTTFPMAGIEDETAVFIALIVCISVYTLSWAFGARKFILSKPISLIIAFAVYFGFFLFEMRGEAERYDAPPLVLEALIASFFFALHCAFAFLSWLLWRVIKRMSTGKWP